MKCNHWKNRSFVRDESDRDIAELFGQDHVANAKLFALAPELLWALEQLLAATNREWAEVGSDRERAIKLADAAIAKATGKEAA